VVPSYEIALLGRFMVRVDGQLVPTGAWRHKRAAELVKILAVADAPRLHSDQAMDLLWPDLAPPRGCGQPAQGRASRACFPGRGASHQPQPRDAGTMP
jgi:hypothetical protein